MIALELDAKMANHASTGTAFARQSDDPAVSPAQPQASRHLGDERGPPRRRWTRRRGKGLNRGARRGDLATRRDDAGSAADRRLLPRFSWLRHPVALPHDRAGL